MRPHFVRSLGDEKNYYFYLQHEEKLVISLREVFILLFFSEDVALEPVVLISLLVAGRNRHNLDSR